MSDSPTELRLLEEHLDRIEELLRSPESTLFARHESISSWSAAQQLAHLLLSTSSMVKAATVLAAGQAGSSEGETGELATGILRAGKFPRGRAKAPESVHPPEDLNMVFLGNSLERTRAKITPLKALLPQVESSPLRLPHPIFGPMTSAEWLRNAQIHAVHHLAIIDELLAT